MNRKVVDRYQARSAEYVVSQQENTKKNLPKYPFFQGCYAVKNVSTQSEMEAGKSLDLLNAFKYEIKTIENEYGSFGQSVHEKLVHLHQKIESIDQNVRIAHDRAYKKLCRNYEAEQNKLAKTIRKAEVVLNNKLAKKEAERLEGEKKQLLHQYEKLKDVSDVEGVSKIQNKIVKRIKKIDKKIRVITQGIHKQTKRIEQAWAYWEKRVDGDVARASHRAQEKALLGVENELKSAKKETSALIQTLKRNQAQYSQYEKVERVSQLSARLKDIRMDMGSAIEFYRGLAAVEGQKQQVIFDTANQLSIFSSSSSVGTAVVKEKGWILKLGGVFGLEWGKLSLFGKAGTKNMHTISVDKSDDYNYIERTERSLGVGTEGKLGFNFLKGKIEVQGAVTHLKNYIETSIFDPVGLQSISKHNLIRHNDERWLPDSLLSNKKVRLVYRRATQLRNVVKAGVGFPEKNPDAPRYLKTKTAERAALASRSLFERFQQRGIRIEELNFHADKIVPVPSVTITDKPLSTGALNATVSADIVADLLPIESLKTFAKENGVCLPGADVSLRGSTGVRYSWFGGTRTDSSRTLLNPAFTYSYEKTQAFIDKAWAHWKDKSANIQQDLPEHLRGVQALSILPKATNVQEMVSHLHLALNEVHALKTHFHEWQVLANRAQSLSMKLTKKEKLAVVDSNDSVEQKDKELSSSTAQRFKRTSDAMQKYQFFSERLPFEQIYKTKPIKEIVTSTYDSFSIAAAMLEHSGHLNEVAEALKSESVPAELKQALRQAACEFVGEFNAFSADLENANVGLTKQHLLKDSLFQAAGTIKKYAINAEGSAASGINIPFAQQFASDADVRVGVGVKVEGELVVGHTNSIRNDWYSATTFTGELRLFGLEEKLIKEGLKDWFLKQSIPELDAKLLIEVLATAGGYTTGSTTLTLSIHRKGGILEAIRVQCAQLKDASNTFPVVPIGPVNASLTFTDKFSRTEVVQELIGTDLSYHILQRQRFEQAFAEAKNNPQQLYRYFGLNSIAQLLRNFSTTDLDAAPRKPGVLTTYQESFSVLKKLSDKVMANEKLQDKSLELPVDDIAFTDVEIFNHVFVDEFDRRKKVAATSTKNFLQTLDRPQTQIFSEEGGVAAFQVKVENLLATKIKDGKTAYDYLKDLSAVERYDFYCNDPIGQQLIAAYRTVVAQAAEMKAYLGKWTTVMKGAAT